MNLPNWLKTLLEKSRVRRNESSIKYLRRLDLSTKKPQQQKCNCDCECLNDER